MSERVASKEISKEPFIQVPGPRGGVLQMWQPGHSGNPTGQNLAIYRKVRQLAATVSVEAIERLIDLMRNGRDERVVYMAVMALLERGVGKVKDHSADDQAVSRIDLTKLSLADQELMAGMLRRILGMADAPPKETPK